MPRSLTLSEAMSELLPKQNTDLLPITHSTLRHPYTSSRLRIMSITRASARITRDLSPPARLSGNASSSTISLLSSETNAGGRHPFWSRAVAAAYVGQPCRSPFPAPVEAVLNRTPANRSNHQHLVMIAYDHNTLRLFGIPAFTLVVGIIFLAALAGLSFGVFRWRQRTGKILVIASAFILLLFALAIMLVLVTVHSGSMG